MIELNPSDMELEFVSEKGEGAYASRRNLIDDEKGLGTETSWAGNLAVDLILRVRRSGDM